MQHTYGPQILKWRAGKTADAQPCGRPRHIPALAKFIRGVVVLKGHSARVIPARQLAEAKVSLAVADTRARPS